MLNRLDAFRVYLVAEAGNGFAMSLVATLNMVYLVTVVDLDPLRLVLVGTVLELSYFLFEIPTGIVADVFSRKWSVVAGFALMGIGFVVEGSFPVYGLVLISQIFFGIGATLTSGAYEAWVAAETAPTRSSAEEGLGNIYLKGAQVSQISQFSAIWVAVALGGSDVAVPIVTGGSLLIVLALFLAVAMPELNFRRIPRAERQTWKSFGNSMKGSYRVIRSRTSLTTAMIFMLIWGGAAEGFDRLWTFHLIDGYELPIVLGIGLVGWFGIIRAGGMIITVFGVRHIRRNIDTDNDPALARSMMILTAVIAVAIALLALAPTFWVGAMAVWAIMGSRRVLDPLLTTWVNRHSEEEVRATVLSAVRQSESLGEFMIGPGLGWLAGVRTVTTALSASAAVLLASAPVWRRAAREPAPV